MKSVVIIEGSTVYALFFFIFLLMVQQIRIFFSLKPSASPEGNHPSKFLLIRINRFRGVREQTNTQTHSHTIALEEGLSIDWTMDILNVCHHAMHGIYKGEGWEVLLLLLSFSFTFF